MGDKTQPEKIVMNIESKKPKREAWNAFDYMSDSDSADGAEDVKDSENGNQN